ncbi:MAG TPA: restriction endonuclease subunit S, partial [Agitococcus sp.]|nr:restriction endonuclease subunit S [Agitococcus sp.]
DKGEYQALRLVVGGGKGNLNTSDFKRYPLLLPPLPEQIKVVEILSTWDNAINTVQKLLANSQQQKKALMQQLLTGKKRFSGFEEEWEEKRFADLYWYQEGPGVRKHQFTEVGVKLFNGTNIQNSNIDLSKTTTHIASEEAYGTYAHFLVDEGDLVIACSGISVEKFDEKIAFVEKHHLPLCMNTSTMRFKTLNPQCSSIKFLRYFLSSKSFKSQIGKQATGSAQLNFGPSHVAKCKIELPNIDEQQKIAAVLTTADQEIDNLRAQLNHLEKEKKALMQQLLTGKRRVKVEEAA